MGRRAADSDVIRNPASHKKPLLSRYATRFWFGLHGTDLMYITVKLIATFCPPVSSVRELLHAANRRGFYRYPTLFLYLHVAFTL